MMTAQRTLFRLILFPLALLFFCCGQMTAQTDFRSRYESLRKNTEGLDDSTRLHRLFELDWEYGMATYPTWATWEGRYERNGEWTDNSLEAIRRREKESEWSYTVLKSIDRGTLSREEQLNYDLYLRGAEREITGRDFPGEYMPVNQLGGIHQEVPQLFEVMPKRTMKDYQDILSRMRGLPKVIDNDIALMRKGLEMGVTPPKVTLRDIPDQIKHLLTDDPTESPIYEAFRELPESIPEKEKLKIQTLAVDLYRDEVAPAFWRLHDFMVNEYIPNARESVGMGMMPGGEEWYAHRVKGFTTTDLTPREIFDIGKREVARIRGEMERLIGEIADQDMGSGRDMMHNVPTDIDAINEFQRTP